MTRTSAPGIEPGLGRWAIAPPARPDRAKRLRASRVSALLKLFGARWNELY